MSRGKLFSIKSRISSINSIFDLSKAMGLVSSSKFSSLQYSLENATSYGNQLEDIVAKITPFKEKKKDNIFIIVASDKGLCGSYNNNVIRYLKECYDREELIKDNKFFVIGKKIIPFIKKNFKNSSTYSSLEEPFELSLKILKEVLLSVNRSSEIFMVYTNYEASKISIKSENLFPTPKEIDEEFMFEPYHKQLFERIFPIYLKFKIYRNILSALVSEHYSRMLAMKSASDNAEDLVKNLKRFYNKERQSIITQEILEVVSGSENFDEI